jgi:hypothetical protein
MQQNKSTTQVRESEHNKKRIYFSMTTVLIATDGGAANNAETIDCANEYYKNSTHQQTTT